MDVGLLLLRVAVGVTMTAHGAHKLFGWFRGPGIAAFAGYLQALGFRRTRACAWAGGVAAFTGGLLLAVGLLTPLGAAAIIGMMITAAIVVHAGNGFFSTEGGFEFPFVLAVAAASIAIAGPGRFSLDALFGLPLTGPAWAAAAIALGVLAAAMVAGLRQPVARRRDRGPAVGPQTA